MKSSAQLPLPPKGRVAVVARQWPRTPRAPLCGILAQRADVWNPVPLGRELFKGVKKLVLDISDFATNLLDTMLDVANDAVGAMPNLAARMAKEIGNALKLDDKGLCIAPSCPGAFGHINSGDEEDLVEELDDLEILASQLRAHAYRIPLTQRTLELPAHAFAHASSTHRPHPVPCTLVMPTGVGHALGGLPVCGLCGRRSPQCPFASM